MKVHRIDHVGVNVNDLPAAKAFFLDLGLELQGEGWLEGAWEGMHKLCYVRGHERSGGGHHSRVGGADQLERQFVGATGKHMRPNK